jgi:hypothetical protein
LFSKHYLRLPYRFNSIVNDIRSVDPKPHRLEKAIYHYAGAKPYFDTEDVFNRIYFEYFLKTPWANVDMFGNIDKSLKRTFGQMFNESRSLLLQMTNLLNKRRRAFLVDEKFQEIVKQIFEINSSELLMGMSLESEKFLQEMNSFKGEIVLFILTENYWQIENFLLSEGFIEGTDFVNGYLFLSERQGVNFVFDSKTIVQDL